MGKIGKILWQDLTVDNAAEIRDFYCEEVGWIFSEVNQGEYNDFNMINEPEEEPVAGICHRRGVLTNFPAQWLNYVMVKDLAASLEKCISLDGKVIDGPKPMGELQYAIIQDPAGAFLVLMGAQAVGAVKI